MSLIKPLKQGAELVVEIEKERKAGSRSHFNVWWLGQSGFLISWNGHSLLFDPYLSDSLTLKYGNTNKPHVRMSELVIQPELLTNIDVVTSSHNHTDHLDAETLHGIFKASPRIKMLIPEANRNFVCNRLGCDSSFPIGITDGQQKTIGPFTFTGIASAHNTVERDANSLCIYLGFVVQFGKFSVYHSGDTVLHDALVNSIEPFSVDLAFLPINGNDPNRGVAGNLNGIEAAHLAKDVHAKLVVPHHYHMFEFNTAEPDVFTFECEKLGQAFHVMRLGEKYIIYGS
jgi:L-ascorbate metabolism protein UlaG (beta-lactamase superfamily)